MKNTSNPLKCLATLKAIGRKGHAKTVLEAEESFSMSFDSSQEETDF